MSKAAKKRYRVAVARPVIQTVIVEVEVDADDEELAAEAALDKATQLPVEAWSGEFHPENYGYDVIGVLPQDENLGVEDPYLQERCDAVNYLLLRADADSGEGSLLFQPWLQDESALLIADVCQDWLQDLHLLAEEGVEGIKEWLEELTVDMTKIPPEVVARLPWIWQQRNKNKD